MCLYATLDHAHCKCFCNLGASGPRRNQVVHPSFACQLYKELKYPNNITNNKRIGMMMTSEHFRFGLGVKVDSTWEDAMRTAYKADALRKSAWWRAREREHAFRGRGRRLACLALHCMPARDRVCVCVRHCDSVGICVCGTHWQFTVTFPAYRRGHRAPRRGKPHARDSSDAARDTPPLTYAEELAKFRNVLLPACGWAAEQIAEWLPEGIEEGVFAARIPRIAALHVRCAPPPPLAPPAPPPRVRRRSMIRNKFPRDTCARAAGDRHGSVRARFVCGREGDSG